MNDSRPMTVNVAMDTNTGLDRSHRSDAPRVALVTGAASGIGWSLCLQLVSAGSTVIAVDLDPAGLGDLQRSAGPGRVEVKVLDVCDAEGFARVVEEVIEAHGRLDLLINNAGVGIGGEIRDLSTKEWDRVIDVNLRGVVNGVAAAYPHMVNAGDGHIVNIASIAGLVPLPGEAPYVASKFAVVGLSRTLRAEGRALGVRCTVVCPGKVETPIYRTSPVHGVARDHVLALWPTGTTPQRCAALILDGVRRNRATVIVTPQAKLLAAAERFAPWAVDLIGRRYLAAVRSGRTTTAPAIDDAAERLVVHRRVGAFFASRGRTLESDRIHDDWVRCDGLRLHLDVITTPDAVGTVVFAPGTNAYSLLYAEILCAIADSGFNVVGVDPRGHGRSDGAPGSYVVEELVADVQAAIDHAQRRFGVPVAVAGSSQGGIVALYCAASRDDLIGAVCHNLADLADPTSFALTRLPRWTAPVARRLVKLDRLAPELKVPLRAYIRLAGEPVDGIGTALDLIRADPLLAPSIRLRTLRSLATAPLPVPLAEIRTPVMVVHGARDRIFPEWYVRRLADQLPGHAPVHVVPDAGHYLVVDRVDELRGPITSWLRERVGS